MNQNSPDQNDPWILIMSRTTHSYAAKMAHGLKRPTNQDNAETNGKNYPRWAVFDQVISQPQLVVNKELNKLFL